MSARGSARPAWLRVVAPVGGRVEEVSRALAAHGLRTVCRDARCPNVGECWRAGTATVLILGGACTRGCGFCAVGKGSPAPPDPSEPARVAKAVVALGLRRVVVTSVTRDDLSDGGAAQFAAVVESVRAASPASSIELLVPDFGGSPNALAAVVRCAPDTLAHNMETVPRLYPRVRPGADYRRSLGLLARARDLSQRLPLKSGLMLGLGETVEEVLETLEDLREAGCTKVTIGQYLPPTPGHLPVSEYVEPGLFDALAAAARRLGFREVWSAPLARSSGMISGGAGER